VIENRERSPFLNAQRYRYEGGDEKQDYFRKIGGYSMPQRTMKWLLGKGLKYVFIEEVDNSRLIEYDATDFPNVGAELEDWKGEAQWCVPTEQARHLWSLTEATVHHVNE